VFILHSDADSARLVRPADGRLLQREVAASGVKYTAKGMLVWSKGDEALIEIDGRRYRGCRNNRAKAAWEQARIDGADFRALGNEPGWILEIDEDTGVTFVTDYGQTRHRFARPSRHGSPTQGRLQYIAPGHDGSGTAVTGVAGACSGRSRTTTDAPCLPITTDQAGTGDPHRYSTLCCLSRLTCSVNTSGRL
jgi:uncharacterized membrane protein